MIRSVLFLHTWPGRRDELVAIFARLRVLERASETPGFLGAELQVPSDGSDHVLVTATWESSAAYAGWLESAVRAELRPEFEPLLAMDPEPRVYEVVDAATSPGSGTRPPV